MQRRAAETAGIRPVTLRALFVGLDLAMWPTCGGRSPSRAAAHHSTVQPRAGFEIETGPPAEQVGWPERGVEQAARLRRVAAPGSAPSGPRPRATAPASTTSDTGTQVRNGRPEVHGGGACRPEPRPGALPGADSRGAARARTARAGSLRGSAAAPAAALPAPATTSGSSRSSPRSPPPMTFPARAVASHRAAAQQAIRARPGRPARRGLRAAVRVAPPRAACPLGRADRSPDVGVDLVAGHHHDGFGSRRCRRGRFEDVATYPGRSPHRSQAGRRNPAGPATGPPSGTSTSGRGSQTTTRSTTSRHLGDRRVRLEVGPWDRAGEGAARASPAAARGRRHDAPEVSPATGSATPP